MEPQETDMARDTASWDGDWTNSNGQNIFPYKDDEAVVHHPMDYSSHDVNQDVA